MQKKSNSKKKYIPTFWECSPRQKQDVERVWSFTYESGKWVVSNIDEGSNSLEYVDMMKDVPNIEETLKHVGQQRA